MTPVAVYHDLVSIAWILLGIEFIWIAVFSILVWRLDFVPVNSSPWPESRHGRIGLIMAFFAGGVLFLMMPETMVQPATLTNGAVISVLVLAFCTLVSSLAVYGSIIELRRAVRVSQQQRRQPTSD